MNRPIRRRNAWHRIVWLLAPTGFLVPTAEVLIGAVATSRVSGFVFVPLVVVANIAFWGYCGWRHGELSREAQTLEGETKRQFLRKHAILFSASQLLLIPIVLTATVGACGVYLNRSLS